MKLKQHCIYFTRLCFIPLLGILVACGSSDGDDANDSGSVSNRPFISWSNNANGTIIKDSSNENFAFFSDTRCLYSFNTQKETSNYCVGSNGKANFAGADIRVRAARSTSGYCIAVLSAPDGRAVDIYTDSSGRQNFRITSSKWRSC